MSLDTVENFRGANMCFLEGGEFEFNFVFNNNTQEQKSVNSLLIGLEAFNQDDGDSLEVYVDNVVQSGDYDSNTDDYIFNAPISFEANDAYVITVKFTDSAVQGEAVSIDALTLNFNDGEGSLSLPEDQDNTINLTNDLSDCEGLVITGVSSLQEYCAINDNDEYINFIFTVYNPTDQDFEFFIDSNEDRTIDSFFLDVSNLINGFDFNFDNSVYFTSQKYSLLDFEDTDYVTYVSSNDSISFGLVYSKSQEGTLANDLINGGLDYQITLPNNDIFSPASNLTSEVRIEQSENCGNVIAPENLLVSAQVTENVELPYCVYDGLVTRNVPVTIVNRYSVKLILILLINVLSINFI